MATKKKATKKKKASPKIIIEVRLNSDGSVSNALTARSLTGLRLFETGTDDQVANDVKTIILAVVGNRKIRPRDLPPGHRLEEDLGYDDDLRDFLHIALNNYVDHKNPGAGISQSEMDDCKTVGDCIKLVKSKI